MSPIDKLEGELYRACVVEKNFFNSREEAMAAMERYKTDELARLRDLFSVKPLPPRLKPLVQEALSEWQEIERNACSRLGMTSDEFLKRFEEGRQKFLDRNSEWILDVTRACQEFCVSIVFVIEHNLHAPKTGTRSL